MIPLDFVDQASVAENVRRDSKVMGASANSFFFLGFSSSDKCNAVVRNWPRTQHTDTQLQGMLLTCFGVSFVFSGGSADSTMTGVSAAQSADTPRPGRLCMPLGPLGLGV